MPRLLVLLLLAVSAWAFDEALLPDAALIEHMRQSHGPAAARRLQDWGELMRRLPQLDEDARLEGVNRFFNRLAQVDDQMQWGMRDYWATPLELIAVGGGDCEDFALAKYFTLRAVGVAEDKLRITYARAWLPKQKRLEPHMVLAYYPTLDSDPQILDNLVPQIRPAPERTDLTPTHSFNAEGLWSARQRGQNGRLGDTSRLPRWVELLDRMKTERN